MNEWKDKKIAVIGSGFMGAGIAQVCAMAGLDVLIHDARAEAMAKAPDTIRWSLEKLRSKGRFDGNPDEVVQRIHTSEQLEGVARADMVIEAVYESVPLKQELFEKLGRILRPETIISSNTSSIPMAILSEKVPSPERFIGTHFFGPVPLMGLVELVLGPATSEDTLERARSFVRVIGKRPVVVRKPSPGFLVNRIFNAAAFEAIRCYAEGVGTPEDIDAAMRLGYGWAAGPFEVLDNAGLDVVAGVFKVMGTEPPPRIKEMLEKGHLGRKTGRGFYRYGPDGKKVVEEAGN
jgi:3-hydroxybutyryl-CoA dehydrogenase